MKKTVKYLFSVLFPLVSIFPQHDLSGYVSYPDSTGIDLIRVEVWQNSQQIAGTITDSSGYFEIDSIITGINTSIPIPSSFELYPNYPSPFDKSTNIIYEVDKPEEVSITIYNSIGQEITTLTRGYREKGFHIVQWDGRNNFGNEVAQGIYFARLDNGKDARFIKLLKMNGALNATGTTIPNNFYRFYKGSNINEDYLIKFIDINIANRVDYAEITIPLPAVLHQILNEQFTYTGPAQIAGIEGESVAIAISWFNYGTQLGTIELMYENIWSLVNATSDSLYFVTIDTTLNGQIPLELKTTALHNTIDTSTIQINLTDIIYWQGQFVDDMGYKKLLGIVEPGAGRRGEIEVEGQGIYTTDNQGNFIIRLPGGGTYTVKAQGKTLSGDPTTFQHTFNQDGTDATGLIFHAMGKEWLDAIGLTMQEGYTLYWIALSAPGPGANYPGNKVPNWETGQHSLYPKSIFSSDTMRVEEQQYIMNLLQDSLDNHIQTPLPIVPKDYSDSSNLNGDWGEILWFIWRGGPAGQIGGEFDSNGVRKIAIISVDEGSENRRGTILQEGASAYFGPWPVFPQEYWGKTVLSENGNPGFLTNGDDFIARGMENYPNLELIDNIFGGVTTSFGKNPKRLKQLQEEISQIEKITNKNEMWSQYKNSMIRFLSDTKNSN